MLRALPFRFTGEPMVAMTAAFVLHAGLVTWMLSSMAAPVAMKQQVIQISMVAPSSMAQERKPLQPDDNLVQAAPPKVDAVKLQKKAEKKPKPEKKIEEAAQAAPSVPTSGRQAEDALNKVAASTEPVFDAAYLHNPPPVYPMAARKQGVQGKVVLEVDVTPQGNAREVEIERSSGSAALDSAARDAVRQWRFVPAKRGDGVVEAAVLVPVEFKLN